MFNNVDVMAHIGGLIGGILVSMGIGIGDKGRKTDQTNGIIVLVNVANRLRNRESEEE